MLCKTNYLTMDVVITNTCTIFNNYCAQNLKALSAHKRGCSKKQLKIVPNYDLEDFLYVQFRSSSNI
jgi:hypothetical protein